MRLVGGKAPAPKKLAPLRARVDSKFDPVWPYRIDGFTASSLPC